MATHVLGEIPIGNIFTDLWTRLQSAKRYMYMEWFVHETKGSRGISGSIYKTTNVEKSLDKPQVHTIEIM